MDDEAQETAGHVVSILLPWPCETVGQWFDHVRGLDLEGSGIEVHGHTRLPVFVLGQHLFVAIPARRPNALDLREVGDDFDVEPYVLGIAVGQSTSSAAVNAALRAQHGIDPFGPNGVARALSRLLRAVLLAGARGLLLDHAGRLVRDSSTALALLGDPSDVECRPFLAWTDQAWVPARREVRTWGMSSLGYANIALRLADNSEEEANQALHAAKFACHTMIRQDVDLEVGQRLSVPRNALVSAYPVSQDGPCDEYVVDSFEDGWLYLVTQR